MKHIKSLNMANACFSFALYILKSILIRLIFFIIIFVQAQTVNTSFANQINSVFQGVDKNKVPHNLLIDYAAEFAELSEYNGSLTTENFMDKGNLVNIYNTLLMARTKTSVAGSKAYSC